MPFLYIIIFWVAIPVAYPILIAEKIEDNLYRNDKIRAIWNFIDIFVIRFGYAFVNFAFVAKVIFNLNIEMALIIGGAIFGFALFCALLSALFSWLSDVRVISSTLVTIVALVIGYFTDNIKIAGAFVFITTTIVITYAIIKKISGKR